MWKIDHDLFPGLIHDLFHKVNEKQQRDTRSATRKQYPLPIAHARTSFRKRFISPIPDGITWITHTWGGGGGGGTKSTHLL